MATETAVAATGGGAAAAIGEATAAEIVLEKDPEMLIETVRDGRRREDGKRGSWSYETSCGQPHQND